jgi:hypothetical protein
MNTPIKQWSRMWNTTKQQWQNIWSITIKKSWYVIWCILAITITTMWVLTLIKNLL